MRPASDDSEGIERVEDRFDALMSELDTFEHEEHFVPARIESRTAIGQERQKLDDLWRDDSGSRASRWGPHPEYRRELCRELARRRGYESEETRPRLVRADAHAPGDRFTQPPCRQRCVRPLFAGARDDLDFGARAELSVEDRALGVG